MEKIQTSSLKNKGEVISDLKEILELVNDGREGYQTAADAAKDPELKALFSRISGERIVYASELKEHIELHGANADNDKGGILGGLHRAWLAIKHNISSNDDKAILTSITTGERAAIEAYDKCIEDYADHADHMKLLTEQRDGIQNALAEIEKRIVHR
ncbi:PA2169 family four-helix-bundle protein [Mucilaginibacter sp. 21P]|nr:PA2169 family four-helix-bundle protein [Mucilaginibacter sp. 21P]